MYTAGNKYPFNKYKHHCQGNVYWYVKDRGKNREITLKYFLKIISVWENRNVFYSKNTFFFKKRNEIFSNCSAFLFLKREQ